MSLAKDAIVALKNIILIQDKVVLLAEDVKALYTLCDDLKERVARLEGKFELLERLGAGRSRRLPPST
jgi:hypothetical protein